MPFLPSLSKSRYRPLSTEQTSSPKQYFRILLTTGVFLAYTFGLLYLASTRFSECPNDRFVYSPAEKAVTYRRATIDGDAMSIYKGNPSPELDRAWLDLLHGFKIRVTADELKMANRTSTDAEDSKGGYLATLDLYHHLHCIWNVRHFLAPVYYREQVHSHVTKPGDIYPTHIDHCLDLMRQHLMCQGDISMYTYDYMGNDRKMIMPNFNVDRMCMNWESLTAWVNERTY